MANIIDIFLQITKISRCSFKTEKMRKFLMQKSKEYGYIVEVDKSGNILAKKGNPKICFQAHYDMVCVGDAPKIEPIIEGNILRAKNSSLGADNGIAIAMMLKLMQEGAEAEFLFTNDEEVGLIGAANLSLNVSGPYMLNLDSEDEKEVFIGCAGGVDINLSKELEALEINGNFYELSINNLPGGHSGVDIDKNIPNAIVELAKYINKYDLKVVSFNGGERINSIPANAKAIVASKKELSSSNIVSVKKLNNTFEVTNFNIKDLLNIPNGVIEFNKEFNVVESSANLALVNINNNHANIELSLRSLDNKKLEDLANSIKLNYQNLGYKVELNDKYPGWKPEINEFTKLVESAVKKVYGSCETKVIHAGLECGLLTKKLPNIKIASIGPNIRYPHSIREYVEIDSVYKTFDVVKEVLARV